MHPAHFRGQRGWVHEAPDRCFGSHRAAAALRLHSNPAMAVCLIRRPSDSDDTGLRSGQMAPHQTSWEIAVGPGYVLHDLDGQ